MLIRYYKDNRLSYANRKRYRNLSSLPNLKIKGDVQNSVLLGDGAFTQIKTSKDNICDYVTIDDTRWYVTSYIYLNGGQVQLNLQRDVIGEFGISECVGKIERGYTDSILKYRKELSLNQILKNRKPLIPNTFKYGEYTVDTHNDELWGVLYFVKPTQLNPSTGEPYPDTININIPAFAPQNYVTYPLIDNGSKFYSKRYSAVFQQFYISFRSNNLSFFKAKYLVSISYDYLSDWSYSTSVSIVDYYEGESDGRNYVFLHNYPNGFSIIVDDLIPDEEIGRKICFAFANKIAEGTLTNTLSGIDFPDINDFSIEEENYTNKIVKYTTENNENLFYSYSSIEEPKDVSGGINYSNFANFVASFENTSVDIINDGRTSTYVFGRIVGVNINNFSGTILKSIIYGSLKTYTRTLLTDEQSGNIKIETSQQLVDEPYHILVFPLFNCIIKGKNGEKFAIQKNRAFMIFNTVIEYLSGENPYLVDAQIYPYCPELTSVSSKLVIQEEGEADKDEYPFFKISGNSYIHNCDIQLLPNLDIKKEYIQRTYSIISPEKSGKFDFNFYDYVNVIKEENGENVAIMTVQIKTALKPFGIISSAVITPVGDSLIGMTYPSDLRGCQPTSNGFECSLSSNAYQTYKRQNSNYQQIFSLQQEELQKQHSVERVNDIVSSVVNTASATAMGAIAGASLGDLGLLGNTFGSKTAGGSLGAGIAGVAVGTAMITQTIQNEKLRKYEETLQKQRFDLDIGTIKNLPNSINRISSFNEIILNNFWYVIETYECSEYEKLIVNEFIEKYGYGIGVFGFLANFYKNGWFLRSTLISSNYAVNLHSIAEKELMGGIYLYE